MKNLQEVHEQIVNVCKKYFIPLGFRVYYDEYSDRLERHNFIITQPMHNDSRQISLFITTMPYQGYEKHIYIIPSVFKYVKSEGFYLFKAVSYENGEKVNTQKVEGFLNYLKGLAAVCTEQDILESEYFTDTRP